VGKEPGPCPVQENGQDQGKEPEGHEQVLVSQKHGSLLKHVKATLLLRIYADVEICQARFTLLMDFFARGSRN
jgi:hypothetical protein